jgi:hypothetical protein
MSFQSISDAVAKATPDVAALLDRHAKSCAQMCRNVPSAAAEMCQNLPAAILTFPTFGGRAFS